MSVKEVGTLGQIEFGGDPFSNIGYFSVEVINTTVTETLTVKIGTAGDTIYVDWGDGSAIEQGASLKHTYEAGGPDRLVTVLSLNNWQTISRLVFNRQNRGRGYFDVSGTDFSDVAVENVVFQATNPVNNKVVTGSISAARHFAEITNKYEYNFTQQNCADIPRDVDQLIGTRGGQLDGDANNLPNNMSVIEDVSVSGTSEIQTGGPVGLSTKNMKLGVGNITLDPQGFGLSNPGSGSPIENLEVLDYGRTTQGGWDRILNAGRSLVVLKANEKALNGYDFRGNGVMPPNMENLNFRKRGFNSYIFDDYSFCSHILTFRIGSRGHLYNTNDTNNENQLPILYDGFYNNRANFPTDENGNPQTRLLLRRDKGTNTNQLHCSSTVPSQVHKMAGMFSYHMDGVFDYVQNLQLANFFPARGSGTCRKVDNSTLVVPISIYEKGSDPNGTGAPDNAYSEYRYDPNSGNRVEAYINEGTTRWMEIMKVDSLNGYENDRFRLDGDGVHEEFRISSYSYDPNAGSNGELTVNIDTGAGGNLATSIPDFADGEAVFRNFVYFETPKP